MAAMDAQARALVTEDVAESKAFRILDSQLAAQALSHEQCVRRDLSSEVLELPCTVRCTARPSQSVRAEIHICPGA